jgi:hypothetical protein
MMMIAAVCSEDMAVIQPANGRVVNGNEACTGADGQLKCGQPVRERWTNEKLL